MPSVNFDSLPEVHVPRFTDVQVAKSISYFFGAYVHLKKLPLDDKQKKLKHKKRYR